MIPLIRFRNEQQVVRWGMVRGDRVHRLSGDWETTAALLREGRAALDTCEDTGVPLDSVLTEGALCSPITTNQQVICQAVNYRAHAIESGFGPEGLGANVFFRKASSSLTSGRAPVRRPGSVQLLDYEIELGLVIGRRIDGPVHMTWKNLHEFVAGVVMTNDLSARDEQVRDGQFFRSKSYRGFAPTGPYLCLLDATELARLPELQLSLRVDGELRQDGKASDMIYDPPATVTELSTVMDLEPGDLIATGTPSGVALSVPPGPVRQLSQLLSASTRLRLFLRSQLSSKRYLSPGSVIEATIRTADGAVDLGLQRTPITADTPDADRQARGGA